MQFLNTLGGKPNHQVYLKPFSLFFSLSSSKPLSFHCFIALGSWHLMLLCVYQVRDALVSNNFQQGVFSSPEATCPSGSYPSAMEFRKCTSQRVSALPLVLLLLLLFQLENQPQQIPERSLLLFLKTVAPGGLVNSRVSIIFPSRFYSIFSSSRT